MRLRDALDVGNMVFSWREYCNNRRRADVGVWDNSEAADKYSSDNRPHPLQVESGCVVDNIQYTQKTS